MTFYTAHADIARYIETYFELDGTFEVLADGQVNVKGDIGLNQTGKKTIRHLQVQFNEVSGKFYTSDYGKNHVLDLGQDNTCALESLRGAPKIVGGSFDCSFCALEDLSGAPGQVGDDFLCMNCHSLISLKGSPRTVAGCFNCSHCDKLTSLESDLVEVGHFNCKECQALTSLKGAPALCPNTFIMSFNPQISSLDDLPLPLKRLSIMGCTGLNDPGPITLRKLWQAHTKLIATRTQVLTQPWLEMLTAYDKQPDLWAIIAAFELHYGVPLLDEYPEVKPPTAIGDLCL